MPFSCLWACMLGCGWEVSVVAHSLLEGWHEVGMPDKMSAAGARALHSVIIATRAHCVDNAEATCLAPEAMMRLG